MSPKAPFEIDVEEYRRRGEIKLTITWRLGYESRDLTPLGLLTFVPKVCEAVAKHFRDAATPAARRPS